MSKTEHAEMLDASTVTLTPKRIVGAGGEHNEQRWALRGLQCKRHEHERYEGADVDMMRWRGQSIAQLRIRYRNSSSEAQMDASELRRLAQACIDMAHDIEANLEGAAS